MTVHVLNPHDRRNLTGHDLLMLLHQAKSHPDASRQCKARQRSRYYRVARKLKTQYVPLCFVDPTVYLEQRRFSGVGHALHNVMLSKIWRNDAYRQQSA
jgi:hypothetical protein